MTIGKPASEPGKSGEKVVHKRLADGTIKEYRYARTKRARRVRPEQGAIRQLADLYAASPEFHKLSAVWQTQVHYYLRLLEDELGWLTISKMDDRKVRGEFYDLRDRFLKTPDKADKLIDTLKTLLAWAYERNKIGYNHALGIPHLAKSGRRRNDIIWTESDEATVYAACSDYLVRYFRFALLSAIRKSDMFALTWANYKDGWLIFKPSKTKDSTGITVYLPVFALPPFKELIDGLDQTTAYILPSPEGLQVDNANMRKAWRAALSRTDLRDKDLRWHDLRGTAITRLLEAGCTDAEVAAVTGHSIGPGTKLGDYAARSKELAMNAYTKWATRMAQKPQVIAFGNRA